MNVIVIELTKIESNYREIAQLLWNNIILAMELEFIFQTRSIDDGTKVKEITIDEIQRTVSNYFRIPIQLMHSNTRKREVVQARQVAMFFSKRKTKKSLKEIGYEIGEKDHATVLHACKTCWDLIDTDKKFRDQIDEIEKRLK